MSVYVVELRVIRYTSFLRYVMLSFTSIVFSISFLVVSCFIR